VFLEWLTFCDRVHVGQGRKLEAVATERCRLIHNPVRRRDPPTMIHLIGTTRSRGVAFELMAEMRPLRVVVDHPYMICDSSGQQPVRYVRVVWCAI
jgi:hypothetical protein